MVDLLEHGAALETAARDLTFPYCGLRTVWCVVGIEALIAFAGMAGVAVVWRLVRPRRRRRG